MTKGLSNLNRFITTLTSTFNFFTRGLEDLTLIFISDYDKTEDDNGF